MEITNRALVNFGFTLGQIKTWAGLVLGRDSEADQGGGVARRYDLDSAFKIYLCGVLVAIYGMGLKQAAGHIQALWPFLGGTGLLPTAYRHAKDFRPIEITCFAQHSYEIKWILLKDPKNETVTEKYRDALYSPDGRFERAWPAYILAYSHYLQRFLMGLGVLEISALTVYEPE